MHHDDPLEEGVVLPCNDMFVVHAIPVSSGGGQCRPGNGARTARGRSGRCRALSRQDKGKGTKEGIKVHGHWKIEIFNPDGTRVSITEFDNTITGQGINELVSFLGGSGVQGAWGIELGSLPASLPCDDGDGDADTCKIGESGVTYSFVNLGKV